MRRALPLLVILASISMAAAEPLARVTGQVTNDGPLPGSLVRLQSATMSRVTVSDAEGRYAFQGVVQGEYELVFALAGFVTAQQRVVVQGESLVVPTQELRLSEITETFVVSCVAVTYCTDEAPSDRLALPPCSDDAGAQ